MGSLLFWGGLLLWCLVTWLIFSQASLTMPENKDALLYAIKPKFQSQDEAEKNLFIFQFSTLIWIIAGLAGFFINTLIDIKKYETIFIVFFGLSPLWITLFLANNTTRKELLWGSSQIDFAKRKQLAEQHRGIASFSPVLILIGFLIAKFTNGMRWDAIGFFIMYFAALLFIIGLAGAWWYKNVSLPEFTGVQAVGWKLFRVFILIVCTVLVFSGFMYGLFAVANGILKI